MLKQERNFLALPLLIVGLVGPAHAFGPPKEMKPIMKACGFSFLMKSGCPKPSKKSEEEKQAALTCMKEKAESSNQSQECKDAIAEVQALSAETAE